MITTTIILPTERVLTRAQADELIRDINARVQSPAQRICDDLLGCEFTLGEVEAIVATVWTRWRALKR